MINLQITTATAEDLESILHLQKECYQTEAELHQTYNIPPLTQSLESIREDFAQGTLFLKGLVEGKLIGSVRGFTKDETSYIGRLIVKKEYQNQKIGQRLMHSIESSLKGAERYELFTGYKSEKNLKLYEKLGYQEFKRQFISDQLTLVYLEKKRR